MMMKMTSKVSQRIRNLQLNKTTADVTYDQRLHNVQCLH